MMKEVSKTGVPLGGAPSLSRWTRYR